MENNGVMFNYRLSMGLLTLVFYVKNRKKKCLTERDRYTNVNLVNMLPSILDNTIDSRVKKKLAEKPLNN